MWAVDTYTVKDFKRLVSAGVVATVEVQGTVFCDRPLLSLAANIPCCYFHTTVARQERRTRVKTSGSGSYRRTRTQTYYVWVETKSENKSTVFRVRDRTGDTLVNPNKATIDTDTIVNKVVGYREPWFDQSVGISDTGRYRIRESVFKPKGFVYVLGEASVLKDGASQIRYPIKGYMDPKRKFFIISRKSEKELTRKKQKVGRVLLWVGLVFFTGFVYCLLAYFGVAPGINK